MSILFAVSALQVIQQSTGLDLGWQDDPCSPKSWEHIECEGNLVTSLYVHLALELFNHLFKYNSFISSSIVIYFFLIMKGTFQHENEIN